MSPSGSDSSNPPPAFYIYDATFDVCAVKGTALKGQLLSDNAAGVYLNGTYVASQRDVATSSNFNTAFSYGTSAGFVVGTNTVDFVVNDLTPSYTGLDYLMTVTTPECGTLKVCKVAGYQIPVGTSFNFKAGAVTVSVPAGPAPGGYCNIVGTYAVGTDVTIKEQVPAGDEVASISVLPAAQLVSSNLATGKVKVDIGTGVTEATYTDESEAAAQAGYLEICKYASSAQGVTPPSSFQFTVNGTSVTVPTNACTSGMQLPAGSATVVETPADGFSMSGCSAIPAANLLSCNPGAETATVQINPGNTSTETILEITNTQSSTAT